MSVIFNINKYKLHGSFACKKNKSKIFRLYYCRTLSLWPQSWSVSFFGASTACGWLAMMRARGFANSGVRLPMG